MRPSLGLVLYRRGRGRASRTDDLRKIQEKTPYHNAALTLVRNT